MIKSKTFIIRENKKTNVLGYIAKLDGAKMWQIKVEEYKNNRSLAQNRLLFLWCAHISKSVAESHGKFYNSTAWKEHFQDMFLGYDVNPINNNPTLKKTSELNSLGFTNFLASIEHYSGSELKIVDLPRPQDLYIKAMGY